MGIVNNRLFRQQAYIAGQWQEADDGQLMNVYNPANGELLGHVPVMAANETERAISAAETAFKAWRKTTAKERSQLLKRWYQLIMENMEELAMLMTLEQGKTLSEAQGEVQYGANFVEWYAEEAKRTYGEIIPSHKNDAQVLVGKKPVGVVGAITPWNFPMAMITRKAAPALAAGCTFVVKPAEDTPFTALALAVLAEEAGFPAGVFNVVTGDPVEIGNCLTASSVVRKISFTGSTQVGKLLMKQCADTVKRVSLELGGNAPFIVFADADIDRAVAGAVASKFRNSGQTCVSTNRFLVQREVYEEFVEKLAEAVSALKVGSGLITGVQQGPLINAEAVRKVEEHIHNALESGAELVCGGSKSEQGDNFFQPTVIKGITPGMRVSCEETFGPLASVGCFDSEEEVLNWANDTQYGLAAYFYTRDLARVWRVSEALEYGMVGINEGILSAESAPFGGVKESGIGREGAREGIEEYLESQYLLMGGL